MKDLNIMFNASNPEIHFIVSAGQSIDIKTPGVYNIVPISLEKIVAGFSESAASTQQLESNLLQDQQQEQQQELQDEAVSADEVPEPIKTFAPAKSIDMLFTQNLSALLNNSRMK